MQRDKRRSFTSAEVRSAIARARELGDPATVAELDNLLGSDPMSSTISFGRMTDSLINKVEELIKSPVEIPS